MRAAIVVLLVCSFFFIGYVAISSWLLPERVAVHFSAGGQPNGWMVRAAYPWFMLLLGLGSPAAIVTMFFSIRFFPTKSINLPNKNYWLSPERRENTLRFMVQQGLWLAVIELLLMVSIHHAIVIVNRLSAPYLPTALAWGLLLIFFAAIITWGIVFIRSFYRVPPA